MDPERELPMGVGCLAWVPGPELGSSEEPRALLTAEPSLQPAMLCTAVLFLRVCACTHTQVSTSLEATGQAWALPPT